MTGFHCEEESDVYKQLLILPSEEMGNETHGLQGGRLQESEGPTEPLSSMEKSTVRSLRTLSKADDYLRLRKKRASIAAPQPFGNGYLSVEQANLILNHLPMEHHLCHRRARKL